MHTPTLRKNGLREQRASELIKKGEGIPHENGVLRLQRIADMMGYTTKKDHMVWEVFGEMGHFFKPAIESLFSNPQNDDPVWRLDLVMQRNNQFVWAEIDGWRHEKKTTKGKDDTKTKEVLTILRRFDPFFIRFKLYTLIGQYQWSDDCLTKVLERPWKYHLKTVC